MSVKRKIPVSVDANTIIHFYRGGFIHQPGLIIMGYLDPFVLGEIQRRAPDVFVALKKDMTHVDFWLREVSKEELNLIQRDIYDRSFRDNKLLFDPKDWGEAKAIALGQALGVHALLTDDTKKSGPRYYILHEAIEAIDTISFWEVLLLLDLAGLLQENITTVFEQIKETGYESKPKIFYPDCMNESLIRLKRSFWFMEWARENGIDCRKRYD